MWVSFEDVRGAQGGTRAARKRERRCALLRAGLVLYPPFRLRALPLQIPNIFFIIRVNKQIILRR